jgi:hypothetical protein
MADASVERRKSWNKRQAAHSRFRQACLVHLFEDHDADREAMKKIEGGGDCRLTATVLRHAAQFPNDFNLGGQPSKLLVAGSIPAGVASFIV